MSKTTKAVVATAVAAALVGVGYTGADAKALFVTHPNVAHFYSTTAAGGSGDASFTVPNPGAGIYSATFAANFFPAGSPSAPEHFACSLLKDGKLVSQSTATSAWDAGFYIGVNGATTIKLASTDTLQMLCGTDDGSAWTWGTKPLAVSLTLMDGLQVGSLSQAKQQSVPGGEAGTR